MGGHSGDGPDESTDYQARLLNFTENLERKDLNMLQEAIAKRLYPDGVSLRQANKELHRPTKWIAARFRLLDLPVEIQEMAANGLLSQVSIERLCKEVPEGAVVPCGENRGGPAAGIERQVAGTR